MKKAIFAVCTLIIVIASCSSKEKNAETKFESKENMTMTQEDNRTKVEIKTSLGDIVIALYDETPKHRDNFIKLVNNGYYNGTLFHRVINEFMVQAGDGDSKNAAPNKSLGSGGPGYTIEAEIVYPQYFHKKGALAAARQGDQTNPERKSSGSQFYIITGKTYSDQDIDRMNNQLLMMAKQNIFQKLANGHRDEIMALQAQNDTTGLNSLQKKLVADMESQINTEQASMTDKQKEAYSTIGGAPHLDGQYTIFGEVLSGMDIVTKIEKTETGRGDRPKADITIEEMKIIK